MTEEKIVKKKVNPLLVVGIGCLVLLVLAGIGSAIVMKFFAAKIAGGVVGKVIENKTGVKTNIEDLQKGKMTFTDSKTGTTVDVGSGSIPDNFPKDFPIYPASKVTSSLSGGQTEKSNGFWLTLSSSDSLDAVREFYKTSFTSNGWAVEASYTAGGTMTQTVKKGSMSGSVSIVREEGSSETQIIIVLGEQSN